MKLIIHLFAEEESGDTNWGEKVHIVEVAGKSVSREKLTANNIFSCRLLGLFSKV